MAKEYPPLKSVPGFSWLGINLGIKDETLDFGVIFLIANAPLQEFSPETTYQEHQSS